MGELGGDLGLAHETVGIGARQKYLYGDVAFQDDIVGREHPPHPTASDLLENAIARHLR